MSEGEGNPLLTPLSGRRNTWRRLSKLIDSAPRIRRHLILASVGLALIVGASAYFNVEQGTSHYQRVAREMGKAFFGELVVTRRWNASHGGVYVWVSDKIQPNKYLQESDRDLTTTDGRKLTKINPAYMTRLISTLAQQYDGIRFKITSLKPTNPVNEADAWEKKALEAFDSGAEEYYGLQNGDGREEYRYMGRLVTEQSCLACHAKDGYEVGMVRGGISVTFPFTSFREAMSSTMGRILWGHLGFLVLGLVTIWGLGLKLASNVERLEQANRDMRELNMKLEVTAITDALTGIPNRLYLDQTLEAEIQRAERYGVALSVAMMDIDHFKKINDQHGHQAGDTVLRELAQLISRHKRSTDQFARWGGEEFVFMAPHTDIERIQQIGDKLRTLIEGHEFPSVGELNISVGVAQHEPGESPDALLNRVDAALYRAKQRGRNRVET